MEKAPEYEISPLSRRAIAARTGFHNYVIEARENDPNIVDKEQIVVDINVSGIDDAKNFHSFTEIEREYEELSIEAEHSDFDELNLDLMRQQIAADKVLARILSGQKVDFDEFHRITRGYGPEFAPEEGILQKRVKLDKLLHQRGLGYSHDPEYANGFNELYLIKNPEDVETGILRELRLSRLELAKFKPVYADEIRPSFVCDADIPWAGHMSTDETNKLYMILNSHPSKMWTQSKLRTYALHEDCGHLVQVDELARSIRAGRVNPFSGVTAMHSPETSHAEAVTGFTENLHIRMADNGSDEDKWLAEFQTTYNELFIEVTNNAHLQVNYGTPVEEALDYVMDHMPFEIRDRMRSMLVAGKELPTYQTGLSAYYVPRRILRPLIEADFETQKKLIIPIYEDALTIDGLTAVAEMARRDY